MEALEKKHLLLVLTACQLPGQDSDPCLAKGVGLRGTRTGVWTLSGSLLELPKGASFTLVTALAQYRLLAMSSNFITLNLGHISGCCSFLRLMSCPCLVDSFWFCHRADGRTEGLN